MEFENLKGEKLAKVNCFNIKKDKLNNICYLKIKTIVVRRSEVGKYLAKSKEVLIKLKKAIAKNYEIRIVEKGPRVPNDIATYEDFDSHRDLSNYVRREYVRTNKDNADTNFANTMRGQIVLLSRMQLRGIAPFAINWENDKKIHLDQQQEVEDNDGFDVEELKNQLVKLPHQM